MGRHTTAPDAVIETERNRKLAKMNQQWADGNSDAVRYTNVRPSIDHNAKNSGETATLSSLNENIADIQDIIEERKRKVSVLHVQRQNSVFSALIGSSTSGARSPKRNSVLPGVEEEGCEKNRKMSSFLTKEKEKNAAKITATFHQTPNVDVPPLPAQRRLSYQVGPRYMRDDEFIELTQLYNQVDRSNSIRSS